tara:strand:- start:1001 stop:1285 length:285 start_codon:yes stop_codon:yes gene_type:complete
MKLNLKKQSYFPESALKDIEELTSINNHNDAVFVLAEIMENRKGIKIMFNIGAICEAYGETPAQLISLRNAVLNELLLIAEGIYANSSLIKEAF